MNKIDIPMNNLSSSTTTGGSGGGVRTITSLEVEQLQNQLKESLTTGNNGEMIPSVGSVSPSGRRGGRNHRSSITHKLRKSIGGRFGTNHMMSSSMKDNSSQRGLIQRGLILVEDHQTRLNDEIKYLKEDLKRLELEQQQQQQPQEEEEEEEQKEQGNKEEESGTRGLSASTNSHRHCRNSRHAGSRMSLSSKFSKLSASFRRSTTN